jgi:hypothetical protein
MLRRSPALKKFLCLLVGVALIAVVAVPAAIGQSTSNKFSPDSVSRKTKPTKAVHKYPWKVTTFGKVKPPHQFCPPGQQGQNNPNFYCENVTAAQACNGGKVRVTYTLGKKTIARKTTKLKSNCSYSAKSTIKKKSLAGKRVRVQARFLGNSAMNPRSSSRRRLLFAKHAKGL